MFCHCFTWNYFFSSIFHPKRNPFSTISCNFTWKNAFSAAFLISCILCGYKEILNWSLSAFHTNSRLCKKYQTIYIHPGLRILYTSSKNDWISSICSNTKKLNATSKDSSEKGRGDSKSQTSLCTCFHLCFFKRFSAISQAV